MFGDVGEVGRIPTKRMEDDGESERRRRTNLILVASVARDFAAMTKFGAKLNSYTLSW